MGLKEREKMRMQRNDPEPTAYKHRTSPWVWGMLIAAAGLLLWIIVSRP
jgi:hypothetical protein